MAHMLVVGPTECGKSTRLRKLLLDLKKRFKKKILVLAKHDKEAWAGVADFVTDDRARFFQIIHNPGTRSCICVIEDAQGVMDGKNDGEVIDAFAAGRHDGHAFVAVCQAATMINKDVRRNCTRLLMFKQSIEDCEVLAREFIQPELLKGAQLAQYQSFYCHKGFGPVVKEPKEP